MSFAVVCPGQGAQSPDLFQKFPFSEKGEALKRRVVEAGCLEPEVAAWLADPTQSPDDVFQNHFSQPLLCLYQLMVWEEVRNELPGPRLFAGYSVGELSAYGCAGAMTPEEIVRLSGLRARAMDAAGAGGMVAVSGFPVESVAKLAGPLGGHVAIVLAPDHCVVGCGPSMAEGICQSLLAAGAGAAVSLPVRVPSHTPLMDAAVEPFRLALQTIAWQSPAAPVLAGIDGTKVANELQMQETLPEQIHRTVRWDLVEERLEESGCRVVLELGPGAQLAHASLSGKFSGDARSASEFHSTAGIIEWVQKALDRYE